jgi:hypothetical protein
MGASWYQMRLVCRGTVIVFVTDVSNQSHSVLEVLTSALLLLALLLLLLLLLLLRSWLLLLLVCSRCNIHIRSCSYTGTAAAAAPEAAAIWL